MGQIKPARARVLAHIACDIGQLHGASEVAGARQRLRLAYAHEQRHHDTDSAGNACRIGEKIVQRFVTPLFRVPAEAFEERFRHLARNGVGPHEIGHGAVGGKRQRAPVAGAGEPSLQPPERIGRATAEIDRIVRQSAEGIKPVGGPTNRGRQDQRRSVERARSLPDRGTAVRVILGAGEGGVS